MDRLLHVVEVDMGDVITRLVIVSVQAIAGNGVGYDAFFRYGIIIGALKKMPFWMRIRD